MGKKKGDCDLNFLPDMSVLNACSVHRRGTFYQQIFFQGVPHASHHFSLYPEMYEKLLETPKLVCAQAFLKA